MDSRQRTELLAQIPTLDLRAVAFEKLGVDDSVALMSEYHRQLEEIRAETGPQVSARRIYGRAIAIGSLVGAGVAVGMSALISADSAAASLHAEAVKQAIIAAGAGALTGGFFGLGMGGPLVDIAQSKFIRQREKPVQERHRKTLEVQLSDDQVAALFLQIAAEE